MSKYYVPLKETTKAFLFDDYLGREFWCPKSIVKKHNLYNIFYVPDFLINSKTFKPLKKWKRKENIGYMVTYEYIYKNKHITKTSSFDLGNKGIFKLSGSSINIFTGEYSYTKNNEVELYKISENAYINSKIVSISIGEILQGMSKRSQGILMKEIK
jgi:hypothetical protein